MAATKSCPWGNVKPPAGSTVNWGDPISNGLVEWFLFNEGSGLRTYGLVKKTVAVLSGATYSTVKMRLNKVISLDGIDDYVYISAPHVGVGDKDFTFSGWFAYSSATNADRWLIESGRTDGFAGGWKLGINNEFVQWKDWPVGGSASAVISLSTSQGDMTIANAPWRHIVVTRSVNNGVVTVYINGKREGTLSGQAGDIGATKATHQMQFGGAIGDIYFFNGFIDNYKMYNRQLKFSEILRLYREPFAGITEPRLRLRSGSIFLPRYNIFTGEPTGSLIGAS